MGEAITNFFSCSVSNVDDCGIFSTFIMATTCVVPFFPEQGVWKPIFLYNHWVVSHFQVDISCGKGAIHFTYLIAELIPPMI